jgi:REP element-mobilizing transposase RayT
MPRPRRQCISLASTPYYHCISRCVRKAYLCGQDSSGRSYAHRRAWLEKKLIFLASVFAIDLCAYAVMHNHYHAVLHINSINAKAWTDHEVITRWHQVFQGAELSKNYLMGHKLSESEKVMLSALAAVWRERLMSISWFMRVINERIARTANEEDECTGRFWEGRFKVQALLDEKAIATCMAYVDLNPIRAGLATTPETSDYTSAKKRILKLKRALHHQAKSIQSEGLFPFRTSSDKEARQGLPFEMSDYLQLLDWTGRALHEGKHGAIPADMAPIFARIGIEPTNWLLMSKHYESQFPRFAGMVDNIQAACDQINQRWAHGMSAARSLFSSA